MMPLESAWLNDNVNGQPVVLEASGDSYKDYDNRVSAMTGLSTVLGWYVHEWLWRNNLEEENQRKKMCRPYTLQATLSK